MDIGVFIPIGNNGWLISTNSPQYMPTFELNKQIVLKAERYGLEFALSMIKLRGFGGKSEFWDHNLESFTLMAGPGRGHQAHPALRLGRGAHYSAG
jgi:pyrimidine oxygenase